MSKFAVKVKYYYERGLWKIEQVDKALELGMITQEEYEWIIS